MTCHGTVVCEEVNALCTVQEPIPSIFNFSTSTFSSAKQHHAGKEEKQTFLTCLNLLNANQEIYQ